MMFERALLPTALAIALGVFVCPAWAKGNDCQFQAKGLSISFGTLDPSSGATVVRTVAATTLNANRAGDCAPGQTMVITGGNGQNFSAGSRRMSNGSGFIAYSLALPTPGQGGPGNGNYANFTFNATVQASDYQNASPGSYSDLVVITLSP